MRIPPHFECGMKKHRTKRESCECFGSERECASDCECDCECDCGWGTEEKNIATAATIAFFFHPFLFFWIWSDPVAIVRVLQLWWPASASASLSVPESTAVIVLSLLLYVTKIMRMCVKNLQLPLRRLALRLLFVRPRSFSSWYWVKASDFPNNKIQMGGNFFWLQNKDQNLNWWNFSLSLNHDNPKSEVFQKID